MSTLPAAEFALWTVAPLIQLVIAAVIYIRKLYRILPIFFWYTLFHIAQFVIAIASQRAGYTAYFYVYWASEMVDAVLALAVVQELFNNVFCEHDGLRALGDVLFRWATLILLILTVGVAVTAPGTDGDRVIAGLVVLQRSVAIIQAGLCVFLFVFCRFFGMNWRTVVFGIALGFGISATIQTAASALRAQVGTVGNSFYSLAQPIAYNLAIGIWAVYILLPSRETRRVQLPDSGQLAAWNRALQDLLRTT